MSFGRLVLPLVAAVFSVPASAALIGLSSESPGVLYSIDPATGAATQIVTITAAPSFTGLEVLNGTIYATDVYNSGYTFGTINPVTGNYTPLNTQGGSNNWHGLAASVAANLLYSVDLDNNNSLVSVTPDGSTVTTIGGGTGAGIRGLAYDDANGILYGVDISNLYTINTATGVATLVGPTGLSDFLPGLAYDPVAQILYLNIGGGGSDLVGLYTLNIATGAATFVGANGTVSIDGLAYLADSAVPEPATMALAAIGLAGMSLARRKRLI